MVPLSAIALTAAGAFNALSDDLNVWHTQAVDAFAGIGHELEKAFFYGKEILGKLATPLENIGAIFGTTLLQALELASRGLVGFLAALSPLIDKLAPFFLITGLDMRLAVPARDKRDQPYHAGLDYHENDRRAPQVNNHTTNVHGGININVVSNQDPSRIAKKTFDIMRDKLRNPTTVPTPNGQLYR
jgi:hypothetical protein